MISNISKMAATIRRAVAEDAEGISRIFLESAEHHASLDPELYFVPTAEGIAARYRQGGQHPADGGAESVTLVAQLGDEIVGFIDARLYQPTDAMHQETIYCLVTEIAVKRQHQNQGLGAQLLRAAENWGRERGAHCAVLEYHAANVRAGVFYQQKMGYRITSITVTKRL